MSHYFPQKVKVRHILEKFGYEYHVVPFEGKNQRLMLNNARGIPPQFQKLEMEANHKTMWAIMYLCCPKIPDFIDHVFPFPQTYDKILDVIYELYKQNKL